MVTQETLAISFASLVYVAITLVLNKKFGGRDRLKQIQGEVNAWQKETLAAQKSGDEARIKNLEARQQEMNGMLSEMMFLPLKSMIIVLPLFVVFNWLVTASFPHYLITLPFDIHTNAVLSFNLLSNIPQSSVYGPRGFFIVIAIVWGLLGEAVLSRLEARWKAK